MESQLQFSHIQEEPVMLSTESGLKQNSEWGTFKDSLRAPIHNWFTYPAGFSYKAVEYSFKRFSIVSKKMVYDPFTGTGTTNVVAKALGIDSIGVEAHPFIFFVAKTKTFWDYEKEIIFDSLEKIISYSRLIDVSEDRIETEFPVLVRNCFSGDVLKDLFSIREAVKKIEVSECYIDFFNLALACILRQVANVATGWPYIAPNKRKNGNGKKVSTTFCEMVIKMWTDIERIKANKEVGDTICKILNTDARGTNEFIGDESIDLIFTSPPYLNNYDYADRTRLETYFFGWTRNWSDISKRIRAQLIMSATTQINRSRYDVKDIISADLKSTAPMIGEELQSKIDKLSEIRLNKGGKKSYDILVGGYFNDMFQVLKDCYRVLKKGSSLCMILGDSAPYGIYIPTDIVLGRIGQSIGFSIFEIEMLRKRGEKWKKNPQRHQIALRESILYLYK